MKSANPFEELDVDPRQGTRAITERLRELVEDAKDDADRARLRAVWEELTMHPGRRVRLALLAHPESRAPLGVPPPRGSLAAEAPPPPTLADLAMRPSIAEALASRADARAADADADALADDPAFG